MLLAISKVGQLGMGYSDEKLTNRREFQGWWGQRHPVIPSKSVIIDYNLSIENRMTRDLLTAAAMVWEESRATTSGGLNPASAKRARMAVTLSVGSGTVRSGAGALGAGRPRKKLRRGAPAQFAVPIAAARWRLCDAIRVSIVAGRFNQCLDSYKSPALRVVSWKTGNCLATTSSRPPIGV